MTSCSLDCDTVEMVNTWPPFPACIGCYAARERPFMAATIGIPFNGPEFADRVQSHGSIQYGEAQHNRLTFRG